MTISKNNTQKVLLYYVHNKLEDKASITFYVLRVFFFFCCFCFGMEGFIICFHRNGCVARRSRCRGCQLCFCSLLSFIVPGASHRSPWLFSEFILLGSARSVPRAEKKRRLYRLYLHIDQFRTQITSVLSLVSIASTDKRAWPERTYRSWKDCLRSLRLLRSYENSHWGGSKASWISSSLYSSHNHFWELPCWI